MEFRGPPVTLSENGRNFRVKEQVSPETESLLYIWWEMWSGRKFNSKTLGLPTLDYPLYDLFISGLSFWSDTVEFAMLKWVNNVNFNGTFSDSSTTETIRKDGHFKNTFKVDISVEPLKVPAPVTSSVNSRFNFCTATVDIDFWMALHLSVISH